MASSLLQTMGEKKSNTSINNSCRALVTERDSNVPHKSPLSYFISISINKKSRSLNDPLPKVRIKIPKLLVKTVIRKEGQSDIINTDNKEKGNGTKKRGNPRKLFLKKAASLISNAFGGKNSLDNSFVSSVNVSSICTEEETQIINETALEKDHPVVLASKSPLRKSRALRELLDIEDDDDDVKPMEFHEKQSRQSKLVLKVQLPFWNVFNKKTRLKDKRSLPSSSSIGTGSRTGTSDHQIEKEENLYKSCRGMTRVPINCKVRKAQLPVKKVTGRDEEDEWGKELCKKRILMGERCRPFSGSLHYDENDNPLPEFHPMRKGMRNKKIGSIDSYQSSSHETK